MIYDAFNSKMFYILFFVLFLKIHSLWLLLFVIRQHFRTTLFILKRCRQQGYEKSICISIISPKEFVFDKYFRMEHAIHYILLGFFLIYKKALRRITVYYQYLTRWICFQFQNNIANISFFNECCSKKYEKDHHIVIVKEGFK